ncbi:MAG: DUF971 domain-containing protein [Candidatus Marinimicrobia bacterium]|nr:DUF971 domain-containing protein [Candidatus Neomarinimicrobiota bacterium]
MSDAQPASYSIFGEFLAIIWHDGHESLLSFERLRKNCPCANCKGEPDLLGGLQMPAEQPEITGQSYVLKKMAPVGHYALQLTWGDGHSSGIYAFKYLRTLCDCDECVESRATG